MGCCPRNSVSSRAAAAAINAMNARTVWVARGEQIFRKAPGETVEVVGNSDDGLFTAFVHNFLVWPSFPFILASADHIAHIGEDTWQGRRYEKVLVSWRDFAPQAKVDQWILWINADSKLLERVWFTTPLAGDDAVGGYNFKEFRQAQGLRIATVFEGVLELDEPPCIRM